MTAKGGVRGRTKLVDGANFLLAGAKLWNEQGVNPSHNDTPDGESVGPLMSVFKQFLHMDS